MLSKEENDFIRYWETNRLRHKKLFRQFLVGIPLGLLFVIPTVISLTSGWYKRADIEANSADFNPMVLFVALLLIVGFTAIFYQRWKWDQNEQRYLELVSKRDRAAAPGTASTRPGMTPAAGVGTSDVPESGGGEDAGTDPELRSSEAKN